MTTVASGTGTMATTAAMVRGDYDRGDRGDRPGRDWNRGGESIGNPRSFHGEPGNEASTTGGGGGHGGGYSQQ